jgi:hypothetical protein
MLTLNKITKFVTLNDISMNTTKTLILATTIFIQSNLFAQQKIEVAEAERPMSKGQQNAFIIEVPQTKIADLQKSWTSYLKNNTKEKIVNEKGEIFVLATVIKRLHDKSLNLYSRFQETTVGTNINTFYQIDDVFVTSENNATVATSIKSFLFDFGKQAYAEAVQIELEREQKTLKDLEKDLEGLHKEEDKELKNIDKYKREIEKAEDVIKVKKNEQDLKQKEITAQKEKMIGVSLNADEKKLQDKLVKGMEGEKKSLIKAQDGARKDIKSNEGSIKTSERNLANIKHNIDVKNASIGKQKELISKVQDKLANIKKM